MKPSYLKILNVFYILTLQGERGTGYGVALLLSLFGNDSDNALLNSVAPTGGQWRNILISNEDK